MARNTAPQTATGSGASLIWSVVFVWISVAVLVVTVAVAALSTTELATRVSVLFMFSAFQTLGAIAVTLAAALLLFAGWLRRRRAASAAPIIDVGILGIAGLAAVVGVVFAVAGSVAASPPVAVDDIPTGGDLRVLSWNTNQLDVEFDVLDTLIEETSPEVVVLTEYFPGLGQSETLAEDQGLQLIGWDGSSVSALIADDLGGYELADTDTTPPWAGFRAESESASAPSFVFPHLERPNIRSTAGWQRHVDWVESTCESGPNVIVIGDFNATVAELGDQLAQCTAATSTLGVQAAGTWPAQLPAALGAQIDHVYVGSAWRPSVFATLAGFDGAGSDHRPIFTILDRSDAVQ